MDRDADAPAAKRHRSDRVPFEYRTGKGTAVPDVLGSMRRWASELDPTPENPHVLVPAILAEATHPRISVFILLGASLRPIFSLDNGIVLQSLVVAVLRAVRRPRRPRGGSGGSMTATTPELDALCDLKRNQQRHSVWWEARFVPVRSWPDSDRTALQELCDAILSRLCDWVPGLHCDGAHGPPMCLAELCGDCLGAWYENLCLDYKCADLRASAEDGSSRLGLHTQ